MTIIPIELSVQGVNKAIKALERYQREIVPKLDKVCKRLAEIGRDAADSIFNAPEVIAEGNGGTDVTIAKIQNGYAIQAAGESVYFVEFGTGDAATSTHGYTVSVPVYPGSWSEGHAKKYATAQVWWYGGEQYHETPTYAPMFYASKAIRENVKRVVEEIFG